MRKANEAYCETIKTLEKYAEETILNVVNPSITSAINQGFFGTHIDLYLIDEFKTKHLPILQIGKIIKTMLEKDGYMCEFGGKQDEFTLYINWCR